MSALDEELEAFLIRALGITDGNAAEIGSQDRTWQHRGLVYAVNRLGVTSTDQPAAPCVWAVAFEAGAIEALRFARVILSDPKCRGREFKALKLVEDGLGHAAIIAALQAPKGDQASKQGAVVAFPSKGART